MTEISSIDDPRIEDYRSLRSKTTQANDGATFLAEGERTARSFFASNMQALSMLAMPEFYTTFADDIARKNIPPERCYVAPRKVMEEIVGFHLHSGILISGKQPPRVSLRELSSPIVALCGIADSENMGAIIRNCAAFGVRSLIVDKQCNNPWLRRCVRVSMGAIFSMNVYECDSLLYTLKELRDDYEYTLYASEITPYSKDISSVQWAEKSLVVFGNEAYGVDEHILALCNNVVHIPITTTVNSINVAASSAVVLHTMYQQHKAKKGNDNSQ